MGAAQPIAPLISDFLSQRRVIDEVFDGNWSATAATGRDLVAEKSSSNAFIAIVYSRTAAEVDRVIQNTLTEGTLEMGGHGVIREKGALRAASQLIPDRLIGSSHDQVAFSSEQDISCRQNRIRLAPLNGPQEGLGDAGGLADFGPIEVGICVCGAVTDVVSLLAAAETDIVGGRRNNWSLWAEKPAVCGELGLRRHLLVHGPMRGALRHHRGNLGGLLGAQARGCCACCH
jgi:hypothetical protein